VFVLALAVVVLAHGPREAEGERIGPQSSPPYPDGDWIINTTGNFIIDETIMQVVWIPEGGEGASISTQDNSVHIHGNLIIEPGGELTLINATLSFDDQDGNGYYLEIGGNLTMDASGEGWDHREGNTSVITVRNNSALGVVTTPMGMPAGPLLRYIDISGSVLMGDTACAINHMNDNTGYIKVENGSFNGTWLSVPRFIVSESHVNITDGWFGSASANEERRIVSVTDSTVQFRNSIFCSNGSIAVAAEGSDLVTDNCLFKHYNSDVKTPSKGVLAEDSKVTIMGGQVMRLLDYALRTRGDTELLVDGTTFSGLNYNTSDDGRYAVDLGGRSDIIRNSEFKSKCTGPVIGAQGELFRLENNEIHNTTGGTPVVYFGTGTVELVGNTIYEVEEGSAVHIMNAAELRMTDNNLSYTMGWDWKVGDYVVRNIWKKGLVVENVANFTIENNLFRKTGSTALEIIDCPEGVIRGNNFSKLGHEAKEKLHGILMDRSFALIENNTFNGSTLIHGFEIFVVGYGGAGEDLPLDGNELVAGNTFNETIINKFAQVWELTVLTIDPGGNRVKQVTINLTTKEEYEVFRTDHIGRLGPVYVYDHTITGEDNLTTYDLYTIDANITRNNISFSASDQFVPDHHQQIEIMINPLRLGDRLNVIDPASGDVLNSFSATLSFHVFNEGLGTVFQDFVIAYRPSGEEDWIAIDEVRLPIFSGDRDYSYVWTDILDTGSYDIMISLTGNVSVELSETEAVKLEALEVFTRSTVAFDLADDDMISGMDLAITGTAMDPMENRISRVELVIEHEGVNGTKILPDISQAGDHWEWSYSLDTTAFLNGRYRLWVMAINEASNWSFARSPWETVTVIVNNEPSLVITGTNPDITKPGQDVISKTFGDTINVQGTIEDLYNNTHIFHRIDVSIDGGEARAAYMKLNIYPTPSTWTYSWTDYLAFSDGPHELVITGHYNNSKELVALEPVAIIIKIDSDRPETDPVLIINTGKPMDEDGNFHISGSASDDWQLTLLQYKLGSGGQWMDLKTLEEGTTTTDWTLVLDYKTLMVGPNYIYVKASDGFTDNETFTILSFAYIYDLEVLELTIPSEAKARENFTTSTTVSNKGPHDSPENVVLHFYIGSIQKEKFISVAAGETRTFEFSFSMAEGGVFTGKVVANPGMRAEEEDSTNNEMVAPWNITIISQSTGSSGDEDDDEGLFKGNTLFIVVGVLVILFIATAAAYYSSPMRTPSESPEPFKKLEETQTQQREGKDMNGSLFRGTGTRENKEVDGILPDDEAKETGEKTVPSSSSLESISSLDTSSDTLPSDIEQKRNRHDPSGTNEDENVSDTE